MAKTINLFDGDDVVIISGDVLRLVCCDCGLTHDILVECSHDYAKENSVERPGVKLTFVANKQSTSQYRRHNHCALMCPQGARGWVMIRKTRLKELLKVGPEAAKD